MLVDKKITLDQLVFTVSFTKPAHILSKYQIHSFCISGRCIGLLDANACLEGKRAGHLQYHLSHTGTEINERILLANGNMFEHLLYQLVRCLAIDFRREWFVLIEFIRIEYGSIVN